VVWSDGDRTLPVDDRISGKPVDDLTKNDHFQAMVRTAKRRGFSPRAVLFDSWCSSLANLKLIRECGWVFLTQLKVNRKVDLGRQGYRAVAEVPFEGSSLVVHLQGFGSVRVFKVVSRDGNIKYWATNDSSMNDLRRLELAERSQAIEEYHRALRQCGNVERCQARSTRAQPHRDGDPSLRAVVVALLNHRDQLVRGKGPDRPASVPS